MENILIVCQHKCGCEYCNKTIERGEKFCMIWKNAWKGATRTNICKDCLIRMFIELNAKNKEVSNIKKEVILENLK